MLPMCQDTFKNVSFFLSELTKPENSSFSDIAKFMGSAPVEILFNADPDAIADKLDEINFDTVDPVREAGMINKV